MYASTTQTHQLHTLLVDQGPKSVLFLHGWSCQASDWERTLSAMDGDYALMALDLPGHGQSEHVTWDDWTITGLARAAFIAAQEQEAREIILVGHSMGGTVALEAARLWAQTPEAGTVKKVILVDTFGLPYGDMDADTIASIEIPFQQNFVSAMHNLVDNTTTADLTTREWIKQRMASGNPARMLPLWSDLLRWSPDAAFAELTCPIHAINGEHIPEPARQRCAPYVKTCVLPATHHFPQFEQPDNFVRTLRQLLD